MAMSMPTKKSSSSSSLFLQNVKVVVRVRPLSKQEIDQNVKNIIKILTHREILMKDKRYTFDRVFKPVASQTDLYINTVAPLVQDVIAGYNCTVFAYGQTGTGKTFTMTGDKCNIVENWKTDIDAGIIPRAAFHVFDELQKITKAEVSVKVSYIELYNEEIRDLLTDEDCALNLYSDTKGTLFIQGMTEVAVGNSHDICKLLQRGILKRQMAPTLINHQSSRSHTVFTISVNINETTPSGEDILKAGKINLVDLAGSENIARSGCKDLRATELANINRSLLTLGRVIHALADKNQKHVPYRDSKLTRILQDSLGGHTKTVIIATISPGHSCHEETSSTLEYATRARDIKNTPIVNEKLTKNDVVEGLVKEIDKLQKDLDAARTGTGFYIDKENYQQMLDAVLAVTGVVITAEELEQKKQRRIYNLKEIVNLKLKQFEDTVEQCKKHEEELEQAKNQITKIDEKLEQEKFVTKWYETEYAEAQDLLKATSVLYNEKEILLGKLETQFNINVKNETITKSAVNNLISAIETFEKSEKDNLTSIRKCEVQLKDSVLLQKSELDNRRTLTNEILNLDTKLLKKFSIEKPIGTVVEEHFNTIQQKCASLEKALLFYNQHVRSFETLAPTLAETYKDTTKNFFKKTKDTFNIHNSAVLNQVQAMEHILLKRRRKKEKYLKEFESIVAITKADIEEDDSMLADLRILKNSVTTFNSQTDTETLTKIDELEDSAVDFIQQFEVQVSDITEKNKKTGEEIRELLDSTKIFGNKLNNITSELETIHKKITEETLDSLQSLLENCVNIENKLNSNVKVLESNANTMIDSTQVFIQSFEDFVKNIRSTLTQQILERNLKAKHVGDTPVRKEFKFPNKINERPSRDAIIQKYPKMEEEDES